MEFIKYIVIYLGCFLVCGIFTGLGVLLQAKINLKGREYIQPYLMPMTYVIPTILVLWITYPEFGLLRFSSILDGMNWVYLAATVLLTAVVVNLKKVKETLSQREIITNAFSGMAMEIPQRIFMQTLIYGLLSCWNVTRPEVVSGILNGLVWCSGLIVQAVVMKTKFDRDLILDLLASFLFSVGIGYLFVRSGLFLFPFLGHFFERITSRTLMRLTA